MTQTAYPPYFIAADVGGTFTDLVLRDNRDQTFLFKALTTPVDLSIGIFNGLTLMSKAIGVSLEDLLGSAASFACGTTAATNAILEGKTARTILLCTEGFRDVLSIRTGGRHGFSIQEAFPEPYIPRELTIGIPERVNAEGEIDQALDIGLARARLEGLYALKPEAIAVSLLWSHLNPTHELELGQLIEEIFPSLPYSLSHQVNPIIGEYRRTSATAIDASLKPVLRQQITALEDKLSQAGFAGQPTFVCSMGEEPPAKRSLKSRFICACRDHPPRRRPHAGWQGARRGGSWERHHDRYRRHKS